MINIKKRNEIECFLANGFFGVKRNLFSGNSLRKNLCACEKSENSTIGTGY